LELIDKEEWKRALRYLNYILKIMPGHTRALYYSAVCKEKLGYSVGANASIIEYLKNNPDDMEALSLSERVTNRSK